MSDEPSTTVVLWHHQWDRLLTAEEAASLTEWLNERLGLALPCVVDSDT